MAEPTRFMHVSVMSLGFGETTTEVFLATHPCWYQPTVLKKQCGENPFVMFSFSDTLSAPHGKQHQHTDGRKECTGWE